MDDDLASTGTEGVASRRVKLGIHEGFYGVSNVFGGERRAIGKMQARTEMEFDGATVWSDFPGCGERRLESLRLAVQTDQNAASKIANDLGLAVFDEERIECFWFAVEAEMEFAAGLNGSLCADGSGPAHEK